MYGTRDVPVIWQDHIRRVLASVGLKESLSVPCMFRHQTRDLSIVVRVDDIFAVGNEADLEWFTAQLKKHHDPKNKTTGPNEHQERSARYLGDTHQFYKCRCGGGTRQKTRRNTLEGSWNGVMSKFNNSFHHWERDFGATQQIHQGLVLCTWHKIDPTLMWLHVR